MTVKVLDSVVLKRDLPEHGLKKGDIGAVLELYETGGVELEFVTGSGKTQAIFTLKHSDVRPMGISPC